MEKALSKKQEEEVIALRQLGHTVPTLMRTYKVGKSTIGKVLREYKANMENGVLVPNPTAIQSTKDIQAIKDTIAVQCQTAMSLIMGAFTKEKVEQASAKDLAISYGIFHDKKCLALNLATSHIHERKDIVHTIRQASSSGIIDQPK